MPFARLRKMAIHSAFVSPINAPSRGRRVQIGINELKTTIDCARADGSRLMADILNAGLEEAAIRQSLVNLRTFPFIEERENDGRMKLVGCHFAIGEGQLYMLDEAEGSFRPV